MATPTMLQERILDEIPTGAAGVDHHVHDRQASRSTADDLRRLRSWLQASLETPPVLLALLAAACLSPRLRSASGPRTRVLHVISRSGTGSTGGAEAQLAELVNRTPAGRYDIDILVLGSGRDERSEGHSALRVTRAGVGVRTLPASPHLVGSLLDVRRLCIDGQYDVVHTWLPSGHVAGVAGARLAGVPLVIASVCNPSQWTRAAYPRWWHRVAEALSARAADEVTVNARALEGDHAAWAWCPAHKIRVIHKGLEPSQFLLDVADARGRVRRAAGLADDARVVGTAGHLESAGDHVTFLRSLRAVRVTHPDVHGVVVGDGPLRAVLEKTAMEMGLGDAVTFLGERPDARLLMAGFDVFLLASTDEGLPTRLLEAAFLGVPSVASLVGGVPDVLPNSSDMFAPGDRDAAARRVRALLDGPSLAAAGADRVRQRAFALFTADHMAKRWCAVYDRVLPRDPVS